MIRFAITIVAMLVLWFTAQGAPPQAPKPAQAPPIKAGCICGDGCKCAAGECPSRCPVAGVPPGTPESVVTYRYVLRQGRFGRAWYELEAVPTATASGVVVGQAQCVGFK